MCLISAELRIDELAFCGPWSFPTYAETPCWRAGVSTVSGIRSAYAGDSKEPSSAEPRSTEEAIFETVDMDDT
jgi:hypothetical protein